MKNLLRWILSIIFIIFVTAFNVQSNGQIIEDEGELMGSLGFLAMTLDAYYDICFSGGVRTDNYLNGINNLIYDRYGFTFTDLTIHAKKKMGRDYRIEAHRLVRYKIKENGGCNTKGIKQWLSLMEITYDQKLDKFHSLSKVKD